MRRRSRFSTRRRIRSAPSTAALFSMSSRATRTRRRRFATLGAAQLVHGSRSHGSAGIERSAHRSRESRPALQPALGTGVSQATFGSRHERCDLRARARPHLRRAARQRARHVRRRAWRLHHGALDQRLAGVLIVQRGADAARRSPPPRVFEILPAGGHVAAIDDGPARRSSARTSSFASECRS